MGLNLYSKLLGAAAMLAMVVGLPTVGHAQATIGNPSAGTYYGSGNPPNQWTMNTANGIELGLRAVYRYGSIITADSVGNYTASTGTYPTASCPSCGAWNYNFSIDGGSAYQLSDLVANLTITPLVGTATGPINVLLIPDNDTDGGTTTRTQNSENLAFSVVGLPGYNPWSANSYTFNLDVATAADPSTVLASNTMVVNAVPEPASMALLGAGLFGLGLIRRRRRA